MAWRRILLSLALIGGCVWCVGQVQQAHSQPQATMNAGTHNDPKMLTATQPNTTVAGLLGDLLTWW